MVVGSRTPRLEISGPSAKRHCGYPDRHLIHHRLAATVLADIPSSCDFLLVDSLAEAYEPILSVLAFAAPAPRFAAGGVAPAVIKLRQRRGRLVVTSNSPAFRRKLRSWGIRMTANDRGRLSIHWSQRPFRKRVSHSIQIVDMGGNPRGAEWKRLTQTGATLGWTIYHSDQLLRLPRVLAKQLVRDPLSIVVHVLPLDTKTGGDEAAALVVGRSPLLAQLKNLCNIVWYNMDHLHRETLLRRLACLPLIASKHAVAWAAEARRTPSRVRFDFNETRTHTNDRVQREIEATALRHSHPHLVRAAHSLIASRHGVPMEAVQLFRGANEAIKASVMSIVRPGWRVLLPDVTYIGHVKAAIAAQSDVVYLPISSSLLKNLTARQLPAASLIEAMYRVRPHALVIGNPSNPLGEFLCAREFHQLFEAAAGLQPAPVLIIDTAFDKFARIAGASVPDYAKYLDSNRIVIIESLSKADGYAGSRSGYIYGSPTLVRQIARLRSAKMQMSLLGAATILASRDPNNETAINETVQRLLGEVRWFLKEASHWLPHGSCTPPRVRTSFSGFVIVEFEASRRNQVAERLTKESNIDVAYVPKFFETYQGAIRGHYTDVCGTPLPRLLRISLGTRAENEVLVSGLRRALGLGC